MKIAFLTSALEPGRDGVGDYTRALAQQCAQTGDTCLLLALNDRWVQDSTQPLTETGQIAGARLSAAQPWQERIAQAKNILEEFAPDWISLQFVPYGFAPRGIVFFLCKYLPELKGNARIHWMFHELWIGSDTDASLKEKLIGRLQRASVLRLHTALQPQRTHSSNSLYLSRLAQCHIDARLLPMFGAIPPLEQPDALDYNWLKPFLHAAGMQDSATGSAMKSGEPRNTLWLGFFGSLHPVWPPEPLLSRVESACRSQGKKPVLLSIGRIGPGEALWRDMQSTYQGRFHFLTLGEQSVERVAQLFALMDAGIATSPLGLLGKSSSVAAMLEHDLPVIVNREDVALLPQTPAIHGFTESQGEDLILRLDKEFETRLFSRRAARKPLSRLPDIARKFRCDLGEDGPNR